MKLTLNKSISATRLNPKSGVPYSEPEANIPFGAILTYIGRDRDMAKFNFMSELYRCPRDVLASAIDGGKLPVEDEAIDEAPAKTNHDAKPVHESALKFEKLDAAPYSIARAKVPGGWLVVSGNASVAFVPDLRTRLERRIGRLVRHIESLLCTATARWRARPGRQNAEQGAMVSGYECALVKPSN